MFQVQSLPRFRPGGPGSKSGETSEIDFDEMPPLVLQRHQVSIGAFLANNGIFTLTIVCAILGVLSNY